MPIGSKEGVIRLLDGKKAGRRPFLLLTATTIFSLTDCTSKPTSPPESTQIPLSDKEVFQKAIKQSKDTQAIPLTVAEAFHNSLKQPHDNINPASWKPNSVHIDYYTYED